MSNKALHKIYVLAGTPVSGSTLYETVVRVGCLAAQGLDSKTDAGKDAVIKQVEAAFGKDVERADGTVLTYYGSWKVGLIGNPATSDTVPKLLARGDGNCNSWSLFMISVLRVQGIGNDRASIFKLETKIGSTAGRLLVKNWTLAANAKPITYKGTGINAAGNGYTFTNANGLVKNAGIPGKGTTDPLAFFGNHQLVIINKGAQKGLFDPSYGTSATDLTDYAVKSFDFVGKVVTNRGTGVNTLTLVAITAANATTLLVGK